MMVEHWKFASMIPGPVGEALDRHFAEQGWVLERRTAGNDTGYQVFFGKGVQVDNLHEYGFPHLYDEQMTIAFAEAFYKRHKLQLEGYCLKKVIFRGQTCRFGEILENPAGDKLPGNWVYGGIFWGACDYSIIYGGSDEETIEKNVVYTDTVGMFTGLYDRTAWNELLPEEQERWLKSHTVEAWTGRPIFQGDIVEGTAYSSPWRGVIVWIDEIAGFGVRYRHRTDPTAWEKSSILKRLQQCKDEFVARVIGNIYDNPDLMK